MAIEFENRSSKLPDATDWRPRPFTPDELVGISPVILAYMKDVDQTMVIASLRSTPHERVAGLQKLNEDLDAVREGGRKALNGRHAI